MSAALNSVDIAAINALSRSEIEITTAGLSQFLRRSLWVGKSNHYASDVVGKLKKGVPATTVRKRNLAQYIAASLTLHANDGWSYMGRAVACLMVGDTHRALHLGYYAELRAAMSLLASAGIGIFDRDHFIVPTANSTAKLATKHGTHICTWLALEKWAGFPTSGALFSSLVRPEGRTLDEWFHPIGGTAPLAAQAKDWFTQWGMDLSDASKDREARNSSSYRPDGVPSTWEVSSKDCLDFVRDMWSVLEPSATASFDNMDRHILRLALERHFQGTTNREPTPADPSFVRLVDAIVDPQGLAPMSDKRLKKFLLRQVIPDDPLIIKYSREKPNHSHTDAFSVLARAVLLLRIATGSANDVLKRAGISNSDLSFWWTRLGEARGLWPTGLPPTTLSDLWADIEESLNEIAAAEAADETAFSSISNLNWGMRGRINVLSSHERVGLWGLCPV